MTFKIAGVIGREVLDSRGNPTVEVDLELDDGTTGRAIVPSGASTGEHEVLELRDQDPKRFFGKGVLKAVDNVNSSIRKALTGQTFNDFLQFDKNLIGLDGTLQKSKLGANAILGVSLACAQALSRSSGQPLYKLFSQWMDLPASSLSLPVPLMNVINGGQHANNPLEIQEFMIVPHGFTNFRDALRAGVEVFQSLKKSLEKQGHSTAVGDEGGFAPNLESNEAAIQYLVDAIQLAGYSPGKQMSLALDVAASSFFSKSHKVYEISIGEETEVSSDALIDFYEGLIKKYPIVSIEDGLDENDWDGWAKLTARLGQKVQLVGDDLFVTNPSFVEKGIRAKVANSVLIKVNQIGSLSETFSTLSLCRKNNYSAIVSHRSGETEDTTIAHLAVGSGCGQIKTGSLSRGERTAKYNELLRIEEQSSRSSSGTPIPFARRFG